MDFFVYQLRKNGVEIKKELLGDQPQLLGDLVITTGADARGRPIKVARLQKEGGEVILELLDVYVDALRGARMVLKGIEHRPTSQGQAEYAQSWLCVQTGSPLPLNSRERFFKDSGGDRH